MMMVPKRLSSRQRPAGALEVVNGLKLAWAGVKFAVLSVLETVAFAATKTFNMLSNLPGIGDTTAAMLIAELPELGKLNRGEIASLVGLAPFNHDSGKYQGQRRIRGGRASVRTGLYMGTLAAIRCNPTISAFAERPPPRRLMPL